MTDNSVRICKCGCPENFHRVQFGRRMGRILGGCYVCQDCISFELASGQFCAARCIAWADCGDPHVTHGCIYDEGHRGPHKFFCQPVGRQVAGFICGVLAEYQRQTAADAHEIARVLVQAWRAAIGKLLLPCDHVIIGTERGGHCVYCRARFPGKFVQYLKREEPRRG